MKLTNSSPTDSSRRVPKPIPERFRVARLTLWFDKFMTGTIITGGLMVIVAVLGIFVFILAETLPLFGQADVEEQAVPLATHVPVDSILGLNKNGQWPFVYVEGEGISFVEKKTGTVSNVACVFPDAQQVTAAEYNNAISTLIVGTKSGKVGLVKFIEQSSSHGAVLEKPQIEIGALLPMSDEEVAAGVGSIEQVAYADAGDMKVFVTVSLLNGKKQLHVMTLEQSRSLVDEGELKPSGFFNLTETLSAPPVKVLANMAGNGIVVYDAENTLHYYEFDADEEVWNKVQSMVNPLGPVEKISLVDWVFGELSLVIGGEKGSLKVLSLYPQKNEEGETKRLFGVTKEFSPMNGAVQLYASAQHNRSFFVATDKELRLCYSTTTDVRWKENNLPFTPVHMAASGEFNVLSVQDSMGKLHFYGIDDKFPEAGITALVGKVWYEGYDAPAWQWQSVGGTDDYEPKISLMPLIFGTIKGTLYALLFAVPIALLAAVYTAHFMTPSVKRVVKPIMEIMASLPSVVLGFFGALYLAPKMEDKVPAFLAMIILIPAITTGISWFWITRPIELRNKFKGGFEYLVMLPVILLVGWLSWAYVGEMIEPALVGFVRSFMNFWSGGDFSAVTFPDLWRNGFNFPYEQRNSLVVGFIMGFAVIPVIFTIAEDSLSNVPPSLISGAEALGASRWQIVRTIVLPIASAGIFSALMIGLGRAVGETMIVLMATGNTPIMEWNIFNGMRTLSANIATELPEAAQHSTHYRVLFLGGLILFMMTFVLNTLAEILRHKLREKFKVV